jgi:hypothetical protein
MAEHSSTPISDNFSTATANAAAPSDRLAATVACAHPDDGLMTLIEKRFASWMLSRNVHATYDEMDRLDALITATPAHTLDGIRLKAGICHAIARGDLETAWPMLRSILTDLQHVPLNDVAMLRSVFAELVASLPLRWTPPGPTKGEDA